MSPTYQDEWRREAPRPQTQNKKKSSQNMPEFWSEILRNLNASAFSENEQ